MSSESGGVVNMFLYHENKAGIVQVLEFGG